MATFLASQSGSTTASAPAVCIARKVIPRVSPAVYCVQYPTPSSSIPSNPDCTPSLHAINRRSVSKPNRIRVPSAEIERISPVFSFLTVRFYPDGPSGPLNELGLLALREVVFETTSSFEFLVTMGRSGTGCTLDRISLLNRITEELMESSAPR
jgi:hypothetical protein